MPSPRILARVVVGSRLQRLALPDSDADIRQVWLSPLGDVLGPWPKVKPPMGPEEDSWELHHFVGLIAMGNPTVLEVVFSDLPIGPVDPRWADLRERIPSMLDPKQVHRAHVEYAISHR